MHLTSLVPSWHQSSGLPNAHQINTSIGLRSSSQLTARSYPSMHCLAGSSGSTGCSTSISSSSSCLWGIAGAARLGRCPLLDRGRRAAGTAAIGQPRSSGSSSSSSNPARPCPLHACLLQYGITDLAAFSAPRHLALSQGAVASNVEPKLAALAAEGLSSKQMAELMRGKTHSILRCSYTDVFQPNLQVLQQIANHSQEKRNPRVPKLTAVGKALAVAASSTAMYLSRDPSKVQQLLQFLEGSLGVGLEQLANCKSLCSALSLTAGAATAACLSLQQQQVPAQQVAHMLVSQPTLFSRKPEVLSARTGALQQHLGLDAAAALQIVIAHPRLLAGKLEASLPPLLRFLDGYMGEEGAGVRLVRAQPTLGIVSVAAV